MSKQSEEASKHAKALSILGASKGGRARASVLTTEERRAIARDAVRARWEKEGKLKVLTESEDDRATKQIESTSGGVMVDHSLPYSLFQGTLEIGEAQIPCHVLNNGMRVLTQTGMISSLGMAHGGSGGTGGDRLSKFIAGKLLKPFISSDLLARTEKPGIFQLLGGGTAYGYEATILADVCEAVLKAREKEALQKQQEHIAKSCEILMRGFAKVGIIALVDEATGYQKVRAKQALQLKLQAFIADELQDWAKMFPDEFWLELARLEGVHYSPRSRPLRWGKYVMLFVYDAIDKDVGKELRAKNPNPHFLQNHHQWLKQFGKQKVHDQLQKVVTIMQLCEDMEDFRQKFAKVFKKTPLQLSFDDISWNLGLPGAQN